MTVNLLYQLPYRPQVSCGLDFGTPVLRQCWEYNLTALLNRGIAIMASAGPIPGPTVLVVDDEALTRLSVAAIVEAAGFRPLEACNAAEAVRALEIRTDIRAVFTDVQMSGSMDGLALVQLIMKRWPAVVPLVMSGNSSIADALPTGGQFIPKPCLKSQIETALHQVLI